MSSISSSDYESSEEEETYEGYICKMRYMLISLLGHGAFANIYLCYDTSEHILKVLKIFKENHSANDNEIMFYKTYCKTQNEYFSMLYDEFKIQIQNETYTCIVLEHLGTNLHSTNKMNLSIEQIYTITQQIIIAVKYLHSLEITHGDLKPENIVFKNTHPFYKELEKSIHNIITTNFQEIVKMRKEKKNFRHMQHIHTLIKNLKLIPDNDNFKFPDIPKIKLIDFGTSRKHTYTIPSSTGMTRYYMAPEIILKCNINNKIDIWALGCIIYELIFKEVLFNPDKTIYNNRDRHHLLEFYRILKPIPPSIINNSKRKKFYYRNNYLLKGFDEIDFIGIEKHFEQKINEYNIQTQPLHCELFKLIKTCLEYKTDNRQI